MDNAAALMIAFAAVLGALTAAYRTFGPDAFVAAYREVKHLIGVGVRRGWRPLLPWSLIVLCFGLAIRVALGLDLPNVVEILAIVGPLIIPTLMAQWTRSKETQAGVANAPRDDVALLARMKEMMREMIASATATDVPPEGRSQPIPT